MRGTTAWRLYLLKNDHTIILDETEGRLGDRLMGGRVVLGNVWLGCMLDTS